MHGDSNTDEELGYPNGGNSSHPGKEKSKMEKNEDEKQVQVGDLVNQEDIYLGVNALKVRSGRSMPGVVQGFELIMLITRPIATPVLYSLDSITGTWIETELSLRLCVCVCVCVCTFAHKSEQVLAWQIKRRD